MLTVEIVSNIIFLLFGNSRFLYTMNLWKQYINIAVTTNRTVKIISSSKLFELPIATLLINPTLKLSVILLKISGLLFNWKNHTVKKIVQTITVINIAKIENKLDFINIDFLFCKLCSDLTIIEFVIISLIKSSKNNIKKVIIHTYSFELTYKRLPIQNE